MFDFIKAIKKHNSWSGTAGGTVPGGSLVKISSDKAIVGTIQSQDIIGVSEIGRTKALNDPISVLVGGRGQVLAGEAIEAGMKLKALAGGYAGRLVDAALAGTLMVDTQAGGNFGNQPAGDTLEVVSSNNVEDLTGKTVTVYGIETTSGHLHSETIAITGTTQANGTLTWDRIHAAVLNVACTGTITIREASGNQTICTIAPAALSAGYKAVTDPRAFGIKPTVVAGGASTKYVQLVGTDNDGVAQKEEIQLNGAVAVTAVNAYKTVDAYLVGDVASASTTSLAVGVAEDAHNLIGKSLEAAAARGDVIDYAIR